MARREQEKQLGLRGLLKSWICRCCFAQGSDLLDPYVGGTERNIAEAFESGESVIIVC